MRLAKRRSIDGQDSRAHHRSRVKKSVVNTDLLAKLERGLRAGVEVTLAHGYGDDDRGSDEQALKRLGNLASRFPRFTFVRVKNTHAKILIYDETWISTSFNWLSFCGDSDRTCRLEEGTLVNIPARVNKEYQRYRGTDRGAETLERGTDDIRRL
jgi:hypothetical protein